MGNFCIRTDRPFAFQDRFSHSVAQTAPFKHSSFNESVDGGVPEKNGNHRDSMPSSVVREQLIS